MVGPDWRQLFDVVIVQADKPSFFTDRRKYGPHWGDGAGAWEPAFAWYLGWGHPLVSTWPVEMVPARHPPPPVLPHTGYPALYRPLSVPHQAFPKTR